MDGAVIGNGGLSYGLNREKASFKHEILSPEPSNACRNTI